MLWAAVFVVTVLAVVLAVGHVFSTLKNFVHLQELLQDPRSRHHSEFNCLPTYVIANIHFALVAWVGDDGPMQVPHESRLVPFHDSQLSFALYNDTSSRTHVPWPREYALRTFLATIALQLHCPDIILTRHMTQAANYRGRVEQCLLYLLQSARFAEPTSGYDAALPEGKWTDVGREQTSSTRGAVENENTYAVLSRIAVEA